MNMTNEKEDLENRKKQFTVLLVEDDKCILEDLIFNLEKHFLVLPYNSGDEAIEAIESGLNYDCVVADLSLDRSRNSGEDVLATSKRIFPDKKAILSSCYKLQDVLNQVGSTCADHVWYKLSDNDILVGLIQRFI